MGSGWTVAMVTCAILARDNNLPRDRAADVAGLEAQAFVDNVQPHVPLTLLLGLAYVESRFNPTGSQHDRDGGMWGILQLLSPELVCRDRAGHDDARRCSRAIAERRAEILDPSTNIRWGAAQLAHRWRRAHARTASLSIDWVGAYYLGHVPGPNEDARAYLRYVHHVRNGQLIMRARLERCRRDAEIGNLRNRRRLRHPTLALFRSSRTRRDRPTR